MDVGNFGFQGFASGVHTGPDTLELAAAYEFQDAISLERPKLPIVNIPTMQHGVMRLVDGQPQMQLNSEAADLLLSWGLEGPTVTPDGDVVSRESRLDPEINLFIPLVDDETFNPIIGFHGKPLIVPNPAVFHGIVLPEIIRRQSAKSSSPRLDREPESKGKVLLYSFEFWILDSAVLQSSCWEGDEVTRD